MIINTIKIHYNIGVGQPLVLIIAMLKYCLLVKVQCYSVSSVPPDRYAQDQDYAHDQLGGCFLLFYTTGKYVCLCVCMCVCECVCVCVYDRICVGKI